MQQFFEAENTKFGVTRVEALRRTKLMIREETDNLAGLTSKLRSYLNDLEPCFAVFKAQENLTKVETVDEQRKFETELILLRAKVQNQTLIKNYNLSQFVCDIDTTLQDWQTQMLKRDATNCFGTYIIDFVWKMIQVKLAFMVRQLNFKLTKDFREKEKHHNMEFLKQKAEYEL